MMKKILSLCFILTSLLTLSSCVTTAVVAGTAATTAVIYDKRPISTMIDDRHITQTATNLIHADTQLHGRSNISVATFNNITLLIGQAQTPELRDHAQKVVENVPGIKRIYNEITIAGATSALQRTNDTWLTSKVKSTMLTKSGLRSNQFKIVTENSIVYIMGLTTHQQGDLASNTARHIGGVTKVVTAYEYIN